MDDAILSMIHKRTPRTEQDYHRALREVLQEAALAGLWRVSFFERAAFYGGTALRLFHGLDRFSEDLDFTLLVPDTAWNLADRLGALKMELEAFGFEVTAESKHQGIIESAFIKAYTKVQLIKISAPPDVVRHIPGNSLIRVKLEIDIDPPAGIETEVRTLLEPFPFSVRVVHPCCLAAGKVHACLCRAWKSRVKGRDWYDLLFFIRQNIPVHLAHLEARLRQSGHWQLDRPLVSEDMGELFQRRIDQIDWNQAVSDVQPFVRDPRSLEMWSPDLFRDASKRLRYI